MEDSIYHGKDGRLRVYVRETKKTVSYPKYLMEKELGRKLLPGEEVHHKDENPLNNNIDNLEVRFHGEHQAEHSTKYHDTTAVCGWCGREFLWTRLQQQRFYSERRIGRKHSDLPFCSRECSGRYGQRLQVQHSTVDSDGSIWCSPRRKLTTEQAQYIRDHYIPYDREFGARAMAKQFGVDRSVIDLIIKGSTYKETI